MPGRKRKEENEARKHPVSCRITDAELAHLDAIRGGMKRGEFMRIATFDPKNLPKAIPVLNREAWVEMSRIASNLNQAMRYLNSDDERASVQETMALVKEFRAFLLGSKQ